MISVTERTIKYVIINPVMINWADVKFKQSFLTYTKI